MVATYLPANIALNRLVARGIYTPETAPDLNELEEVLTAIEIRLDEFLHRRVAPTEYTERYVTNPVGDVLLWQDPVIDVLQVGWFRDVIPGSEIGPVEPLKIDSVWRQKRRLNIPLANTPIEVTYVAGFDPIPPVFPMVVMDILTAVIKSPGGLFGGLQFLDEPVKDVSSLSLPGGISKSFRFGGGSSSGSSSDKGRVLDRYVGPLLRYRKKVIC